MRSLAILTLVVSSACSQAPVGAVPDILGSVPNAETQAPTLCDWVGRHDAIVMGTLVRLTPVADSFVQASGTISDTITDSCNGTLGEVPALELEVAVESVLFGEDPGATVVARVGSEAAKLLFPMPLRESHGSITWDGVGTADANGRIYETPLVAGQNIGVGLLRSTHPLSPVDWTLGIPRFFMQEGDRVSLHFSRGGEKLPLELTGVTASALAKNAAVCEHDEAYASLFANEPEATFGTLCLGENIDGEPIE